MLRVALRPRYLALLALMIAATVVCGMLASWQWERAHRAITERSDEPAHLGNLVDVTTVGEAVTNERVGALVDARGQFHPDQQVLVTDRVIEGQQAVIVVTAMSVHLPDGSEALIPVARGWIPASDALEDPSAPADPIVKPGIIPEPPSGQVTITGRLEASEAASSGIHDGIAQEIATPLLVNEWGGPMFAGYLAQTSAAPGLNPMPPAGSAFTEGLNWQNLGYALQWVIFGGFFLYLWLRTVRTAYEDERSDARAEARAAVAPASQGAQSPAATATEPSDPDPAPAAVAASPPATETEN